MVLIRKRYFRKHCETLLQRGDLIKPSRTKTFLTKTFTLPSKHIGKDGGDKKKRKAGVGQPISAPSDPRLFAEYAERMVDSPTGFDNTDEDIDHADVASGRDEDSGRHGHLSPIQEELDSGTVTANTTQPSSPTLRRHDQDWIQPRPSVYHQATHTLHSPVHAHFAQRQTLRARTRGMSMMTESQIHRVSSAPSQAPTSPPPHTLLRKGTATTRHAPHAPVHIPRPHTKLHTGLGGFPGPIAIARHILPPSARSALSNRLKVPEKRHTLALHPTILPQPTRVSSDVESGPIAAIEESWDDVKAHVAKWMPEKLGGLVIGRNGRFFTEELDDETLEILGGVEYRALRLLSYLVPAVRPPHFPRPSVDPSTWPCSS